MYLLNMWHFVSHCGCIRFKPGYHHCVFVRQSTNSLSRTVCCCHTRTEQILHSPKPPRLRRVEDLFSICSYEVVVLIFVQSTPTGD